jgi:hypothetical protein
MLGVLLVCFAPLGIAFSWSLIPRAFRDPRALYVALLGYAVRIALSSIIREFPFFSYGATGDAPEYEYKGIVIARIWQFTGIHYATSAQYPSLLAETTFPPNLFGLVVYLNGEPTHMGCTAVVAAMACAIGINIYSLACEMGCRRNVALWIAAGVLFLPTFVYYTGDTHKDGVVAFFVFLIFGASVRLARKFSIGLVAVAVVGLIGLWLTRFYLIFVMSIPLSIGLLGTRGGVYMRAALVVLTMGIVGIGAAAYSDRFDLAVDTASTTYERGTAANLVEANSKGGSGVMIEGSGPRAFAQRLVYTMFAPFPWQSGSLGLQLAKVEMVFWYFFAYRALLSARIMWARRRSDLVLFAAFILPTIFVYAISFSNIGLVVRERTGMVLCTMLMAALSWGVAAEQDDQGVLALSEEPAGAGS